MAFYGKKVIDIYQLICYNLHVVGGDNMDSVAKWGNYCCDIFPSDVKLREKNDVSKKEKCEPKGIIKFFEVISLIIEVKKIVKSSECKKVIKNYITVDSKIRNGQPIIKNTRITDKDVCAAIIENKKIEEIIKEYPSLKKEEIVAAALSYLRRTSFLKLLTNEITF